MKIRDVLYRADNLLILSQLKSESVDLIYLDPPFGTGKNYRTYKDKLDSISLLQFLFVRLLELRRILKPTGSIYLHCDWRNSHYLRLLLDFVFGKENFQNEIVWHYYFGACTEKRWARKHDIILFYSKSKIFIFNVDSVREPYHSKKGKKLYSRKQPLGRIPRDVWEISQLTNNSKERLGFYPTQKPLRLLEKIILASSNPKDIVLDPFCGSGTTLVAAKKLGRYYIGIDNSKEAIRISKQRLRRLKNAHLSDTV